MKYRIIEERDGNNNCHYEIHFWKRSWFKMKWVPLYQYNHDFSDKEVWKSHSRDKAIETVNEYKITRTVTDEGEI